MTIFVFMSKQCAANGFFNNNGASRHIPLSFGEGRAEVPFSLSFGEGRGEANFVHSKNTPTCSGFAFLLFFLLILVNTSANAQKSKSHSNKPVVAAKDLWVDSVYNTLSQEEKIGQLFMVAAYSGGKNYNEDLITELINKHQIGGLIFMQGGPGRQAILTNKYQHAAQVPLLIGFDAEWGVGMRLDSVRNFPRQMMLGATHSADLVYSLGSAVAKQCKRLGIHLDFAPVIDINNNPANPVINSRSFGEDKTWVAKLGIAYMRGLQHNSVMACAKHFPGHGDTNVDSHKDLPLISKSQDQLDTLELYPFKRLIDAGVNSIMVAHLQVPALDTEAHLPTTLSKNTVTGLLKNELGFKGLVITDALGMQGVTKYFPAGEADLRAFIAGNDILLFSQDVPLAIARIKNALDSGIIKPERLQASVKKILAAKYDAGLYKFKDIEVEHIADDLNMEVDSMRIKVARAAITVVRDDNNILKKINNNMHVGYVGINADGTTPTPLYQSLVDAFDIVPADWFPKGSNAEKADNILKKIKDNDATIVTIHNLSFNPNNNFGLTEDMQNFLLRLQTQKNVMIVLLGNAYAMQYFYTAPSILVSYEDDSLTEKTVAGVLLGKYKAKGTLPVTPQSNVCVTTIQPKVVERKETAHDLHAVILPSEAGVTEPEALDKLDMFIQRCIADGAFPGCRIIAAKDGKIFYDKLFGYLKYDKVKRVDTNTLYDMASCTKILATTLSVMRLYEEGKIDLDKTIADYLPEAAGTNKAKIKVRDLLLHQAGLKAFIPFYKQTVDDEGWPLKKYYRSKQKGSYNIEVTDDLFMRDNYRDTIWSTIYASEVASNGKSVYSDLDYYFLWKIVEKASGTTIDQYVSEQFYKPLGLTHILYNPMPTFDTDQIAPTEWDVNFRQELVYGFVHDPGAAMMGGVAGHAGIFASAHDVAVIFQMLMNKGVYRGTRYFKASTIDLFTGYRSIRNHRGLGFDKPATDEDDGGPCGTRCTGYTFGHTGFTGTCAWSDPATGVLFVFLSNRVYPSATNTKIIKMNVRTIAQDYIYESLGLPVVHNRRALWDKQTGE